MRGSDERSGELFSHVDLEDRVPANRAAIATVPTSVLCRRNPASSADGAPPTPTICGSRSRARSVAGSATNSPYRCAAAITGLSIDTAMKPHVGRSIRLIRWWSPTSCGSEPVSTGRAVEELERF
jgi:hypothetical protein